MAEDGFEVTARKMRRLWFKKLREEERDAIIKPHFEKAYPTNESKRELKKQYENDIEWY